MMKAVTMTSWPTGSGATTGYEPELWVMADAVRGSKGAAKVKSVIVGLIILKFISDALDERRIPVLATWGEEATEDGDGYIGENILWVPQEIRWTDLEAQARQPTIGQTPDRAMATNNQDNPSRMEGLASYDSLPALDQQRLSQLIETVGNGRVGDAESRSKDLRGWVKGYLLSEFACAGGKRGGE